MFAFGPQSECPMPSPVGSRSLGVYCHVPFCPGGCDFCSFYRTGPHRDDVIAFLGGIEKEVALLDGPLAADTLFFGGGTPGLLATKDLLALGETILARLVRPPTEWTVEMAPTTVKADKLRALKEIGVTRISIGVQSFDPGLLRAMGRRHKPERARAAFGLIRSAGFDNVNVDMIFALPGQTAAMVVDDLAEAARLEPEHISTYCLTLEENTPLRERVLSTVGEPDADREAELFERAWEFLAEAGFGQYEISNFARPGRACLHNINTWAMGEWLGLGPSAASQRRGRRYSNPAGLAEWLRGVEAGGPVRVDEVVLTGRLLAEDAIIFGLRMNDGIAIDRLKERFEGVDLSFLDALWRDLAVEGIVAVREPDRIALTPKGRLVADRVGVAVMEAFDEALGPETAGRSGMRASDVISIRKADESDAPAAWRIRSAAILNRCADHYPREALESWTSGEMTDEFVSSVAESFHVATLDGQVIGTGMVDLDSGTVDAIFVHPDQMGQGVGRRILFFLEELANRAGLTRLKLDSTLNAFPFYRACGYTGEAISRYHSPRGLSLECIPMKKSLTGYRR